MTDPKEINEEINEELSTDELKSVSGGSTGRQINLAEICDVGTSLRNPHGSGSGMTRVDFVKSKTFGDGDGKHE